MKKFNPIHDFRRNISDGKKRSIPVGVAIRILVSNPLFFVGIAFFGFGVLILSIFFPFQMIFDKKARVEDPAVEGIISAVQKTNASVNEEPVYQYTYTYSVPDGDDYEGVGYATGEIFETGDDVIVYYRQTEPQISMVEGFRNSKFGGEIEIFMSVFPISGLLILFFSIRKSIKNIKILRLGKLAKGKLLKKEATNTTINEQRVYKMIFEFVADDGQVYRATAKTHRTYYLEDDEEENLFYDPSNPENALLLDTLPNSVKKFLLKSSL